MKTFINKQNLKFYLITGAIWLLLLSIHNLFNYSETFGWRILNEFWRSLFILLVNFIFLEYGLRIIWKKRSARIINILLGTVLISAQLFLVSFGLYAWRYIGIQLDIYMPFREVTLIPDEAINYIVDGSLFEFQTGVLSIFFFGFAKLLYYSVKLKQASQQLRIEKQEAELHFLKSQTNPHFLFNTLNNIYALAKDKSELAPESILRLSKIMRFMLYETGEKFISLEKELEMIQDYIDLEKLRYDNSLRINMDFGVENMHEQLPPLLLLPLVENAFKHGISESGDDPFIDMHLSTENRKLLFVLKNSAVDNKQIAENIGLTNLRRQLELLYSDYNLTVTREETVFIVSLTIDLASHV